MGHILHESANLVFLNPWVTGYIFPIFSTVFFGGWLALITANIIYLRDAKTRVNAQYFDLYLALMTLPEGKPTAIDQQTIVLIAPLASTAQDLFDRGHLSLGRVVAKIATDIRASVEIEVELLREDRKKCPMPEHKADWERSSHKKFLVKVGQYLDARSELDTTSFISEPGSWLAVLELTTLAKWIEKSGGFRSSDRCEKCGHRHLPI